MAELHRGSNPVEPCMTACPEGALMDARDRPPRGRVHGHPRPVGQPSRDPTTSSQPARQCASRRFHRHGPAAAACQITPASSRHRQPRASRRSRVLRAGGGRAGGSPPLAKLGAAPCPPAGLQRSSRSAYGNLHRESNGGEIGMSVTSASSSTKWTDRFSSFARRRARGPTTWLRGKTRK